jgi:hypothetical protein
VADLLSAGLCDEHDADITTGGHIFEGIVDRLGARLCSHSLI